MKSGGPAKIFTDYYKELIRGEKKEIFGIPFGLDFFIDTVSNAPIHTMHKIKYPVLFLQELADNPFRCADAKMAYQLMKDENKPVKYIDFPDGSHGLENVIDEVLHNMFEWLAAII